MFHSINEIREYIEDIRGEFKDFETENLISLEEKLNIFKNEVTIEIKGRVDSKQTINRLAEAVERWKSSNVTKKEREILRTAGKKLLELDDISS